MKKPVIKIRDVIAVALVLAGVAFMSASLGKFGAQDNTDKEARKVSRYVASRMSSLDNFIGIALAQDCASWMDLGKLPQDMVIYRYCNDTLQSWANEFPVPNDDISRRVYLPFVANPRVSFISPLAEVTDSVSFMNMGHKWYLVKSVPGEDCRIIAGLEIVSMHSSGPNQGVNPHLRLSPGYSIRPLSYDGGAVVSVDGRPQFEVLMESIVSSNSSQSPFLWVALAFLVAAALVFLSADRSLRRLGLTLGFLSAVMVAVYFIGRTIRERFTMFSSLLYAGNEVLYSLGAVVIINLAILMFSLCLYMSREAICARLRSRWRVLASYAVVAVITAGIIVYTFTALRSIILNSGISLELYKFAELSPFCVVVYASFITMLMSVPLLIQTLQTPAREVLGIRFDAFSLGNRTLLAAILSLCLVLTSGVLGFRKEQDRMEVLANRLSFDRDISLELRLRSMEGQIAEDMLISALSVFNNTASTIQRRILDNYMSRGDQDYSVSVYVFNSSNNTKAAAAQYNALLKDGTPIADNSRFMYVKRNNGRSYYIGLFMYLIEGDVSRVLVMLESRDTRGNKGYAGIFGINPPGKVVIPNGYSYARYEGYDLKSYRGNYAYPIRLDSDKYREIYEKGNRHLVVSGNTHFVTVVGDNEAIVLSRAKVPVLTYVVAVIFLAMLAFFTMSLLVIGRKKESIFVKSYFRTRISGIIMLSLSLTLVAMASVSVFFVYSRNDINMHSVMSDKIGSIISMIEAETADVSGPSGINRNALSRILDRVSDDTNSDITLYTPSGRMLVSTVPMLFDRQMLSERMDGNAYGKIVYGHMRYWTQKERIGNTRFYSMYAPVRDSNGNMIAIICSPYYEENYDFEEDAFTHSMTIISLFLLFLMVSLFMVSHVVDKMFRPLSEMGRRMSNSDLENLEYIDYDRDDEISSLVKAYNRMVTELSESSRKLAQAERDKAWSGMARQVAHEIKNPLTPMKLQLQRVIRLKQKNDPVWQDRFDEAAKVLLDHIDILTDTANEFSTFAKLYTEEPSEINLDKLIMEEISMFDNKDNVVFDYYGLNDVTVMGPKPQLTRVFVNLINNAVQAIDERPDGRILISVRNSMKDGYYDIVFEDNGPGVSDENVNMLFTPNFTTKSSGSGLGLAISRSILEKCGASISYSRSFALGGACFTINYPK